MKKEKLTADRIISEYELFHQKEIKSYKEIMVWFISYTVTLALRFIFIKISSFVILTIFLAIGWIWIVCTAIYEFTSSSKRIRMMRNGDYGVVADKLSYKDNRTTRLNAQSKSYYLHFLKVGKYMINSTTVYPLSKEHRMDKEDLYYQSDYGDEFYLVICGNKIIFAYSAKYFEPEGLEIEKAYEDGASTAE